MFSVGACVPRTMKVLSVLGRGKAREEREEWRGLNPLMSPEGIRRVCGFEEMMRCGPRREGKRCHVAEIFSVGITGDASQWSKRQGVDVPVLHTRRRGART